MEETEGLRKAVQLQQFSASVLFVLGKECHPVGFLRTVSAARYTTAIRGLHDVDSMKPSLSASNTT